MDHIHVGIVEYIVPLPVVGSCILCVMCVPDTRV
jgi:hypothetical protein